MPTDLHCLVAVMLLGRHEFVAAVAVLLFVPIHKRRRQLAELTLAGKSPSRVVRPVFVCSEHGLGKRVVFSEKWP